MDEGQNAQARKDLEEEVWAAISAFEQILEAMPNDRASLEALAHAYEQIGDHTRGHQYLVRLVSVLLQSNDLVTAAEFVPRLAEHAADDPQAAELIERIQSAQNEMEAAAGPVSDMAPGPFPSEAPVAAPPVPIATFNVAEEMALAWKLMETDLIDSEQYAAIVQDLTDMSSEATGGTVSALHVLEGRQFKNLERIVAHMAEDCNTPYVSLSFCDLDSVTAAVLPMSFMVEHGTIVFDKIGREALVACLNPYSEELRKAVASAVGAACHFYITLASEFDTAIERLSASEPGADG